MNKQLKIAKEVLLQPAGISEGNLQKILGNILGNQVDNADLYFETTLQEGWMLEDGIVKEGSFAIERGVGVRAISREKTGFAYCDDIYLPSLDQAAAAAKTIAKSGGGERLQVPSLIENKVLYTESNPILSLPRERIIQLLQELDIYARNYEPRVKKVTVSLNAVHETVLIFSSDGTLAADVRPLVRLNVEVIVEQNGLRESGFAGGGGRTDYNFFLTENRAFDYVKEAIRLALVKLDAVPAPAGNMPVILGPGWPGVLLHEAIGHGLEGDFNRKGSSAFTGRIGERVASPCCTVVDNGSIPGRRGSLTVDDEGTPTQCTVLIENGILKNYLQDKLNAKLMGMTPTGNGRRESYAHCPIPRMTNTYMLAGNHDPEEILTSVDKGIYAVNFDGGQVDITSGKFVFSTSEAYLIEKGRITQPIKGATLIGNGPDILTRVSMVGTDLKLDSGIGVCGKDGQSVPVGVGQPTLKIDAITVGGTGS